MSAVPDSETAATVATTTDPAPAAEAPPRSVLVGTHVALRLARTRA